MAKKIGLYIMAVFYFLAGLNHFLHPEYYMRIMPPYIPEPLLMINLSGAAESLLGLGLFFKKTRALCAWGVIALLIAVFPANIYMYTAHISITGEPIADWIYIVRLLLQGVLIWWAYLYTKKNAI
jgi:uncharacterized membrane protein